MILRFKPVYKERIWGGQDLRYKLNKRDLPKGNIGESWEVSAHREGESIISDGKYRGENLSDLFLKFGEQYFGKKVAQYSEFPLLIKYLDAKDDLSVQVHPDNEYALKNENSFGKEEVWYVLDAEPEAKIVYGLVEGCNKKEFEEAIELGTVTENLNFVDVKKGDIFFIPAGTVHATGKGIRIAEIQQSSDITYRVYDYDRVDKNGKKRDLHIQKSLEVINYGFQPKVNRNFEKLNNEGYSLFKYGDFPYFSLNKIIFDRNKYVEYKIKNDSFEVFMCIEGELSIIALDKNNNITDSKIITKGETVVLTVEEKYKLKGIGELLVSHL